MDKVIRILAWADEYASSLSTSFGRARAGVAESGTARNLAINTFSASSCSWLT